MIDFVTTIRRLLPSGRAWIIPPGYLRKLIAGLAAEPARVADFLNSIALEANPGTAINTLQEWFEQYGILWRNTGGTQAKQHTALARFISLGGQDIA